MISVVDDCQAFACSFSLLGNNRHNYPKVLFIYEACARGKGTSALELAIRCYFGRPLSVLVPCDRNAGWPVLFSRWVPYLAERVAGMVR